LLALQCFNKGGEEAASAGCGIKTLSLPTGPYRRLNSYNFCIALPEKEKLQETVIVTKTLRMNLLRNCTEIT
jgi:hypothetical protein